MHEIDLSDRLSLTFIIAYLDKFICLSLSRFMPTVPTASSMYHQQRLLLYLESGSLVRRQDPRTKRVVNSTYC